VKALVLVILAIFLTVCIGCSKTDPKVVEEYFIQGKEAFDTKDYAKALEMFNKAADENHAEAQWYMSRMYYEGIGVPEKMYIESFKLAKKAAKLGLVDAQGWVGYCYHYGMSVHQDYSIAMKWYLKAADQGDASSQYCVGKMHYHGDGVKQDYAKALKWFSMASSNGCIQASYDLGDMYFNGIGVESNHESARDLFILAAEQHVDTIAQHNLSRRFQKVYANAQYNLGLLFLDGHGVQSDIAIATEWLKKADDSGHKDAKHTLDSIEKEFVMSLPDDSTVAWCERGRWFHVRGKYDEAIKWYKKAILKESPDAHYYMGMMYLIGEGVEWDYKRAAQELTIAARKNHDDAMYQLGMLYWRGEGVTKDYLIAALLWSQAVDLGNTWAKAQLEDEYVQSIINKATSNRNSDASSIAKGFWKTKDQ
jgi:uncharacterized protein